MSAPLTKGQKRYLAQLSDRAFRLLGARARGAGQDWPEDNSANRAAFRHQHVIQASAKHGLRCCGQADYAAVKAHFLSLLGEDGAAMNALVRGGDNARRQKEWLIQRELTRLGRTLPYAAGICRRMFHGLSILEASPDQLQKVVSALRYIKTPSPQPSPPTWRGSESPSPQPSPPSDGGEGVPSRELIPA